ncbi:Acidic fibroblast growth factor intracellular-binding protein [Schistosoma japonicum]|nr:Acidic fibroblast growth factor intracellular-binding protein [Schistosoma japonicum]
MQYCSFVDVTVTSPSFVDMEMFDFWLHGRTISQACSIMAQLPSVEEFGMTSDMLAAHVRDHFAQFALLESGLRHPNSFMQDCAYHQLTPETRKQLIYLYYSLDESFLRELVGRRLSNKSRRELADIAERCELQLRSCKRQFDNLWCVARRTEDLPGPLTDNIKNCFLLPERLAECYAAVIFITSNRYIHTNQKGEAVVSIDLDLQFFHDLKEFKPLTEKKEYLDKHKLLVIRNLSEIQAKIILTNLESNFKSISKAVINLACGLSHAREMRNFFLDIIEKLVEPMRALNWPSKEVKMFFDAYHNTVKALPLGRSSKFLSIWTRFIVPFSNCVMHLYRN